MELTIDGLTKDYKGKRAVDDVSLSLSPGIWGLLGANGAGKTTLMRMIIGILKPTAGEVRYDGVSAAALGEKYRDILGYLPQEFGFYPEFTVSDYLEYMAALKGISARNANRRIDELLVTLTLADVRKKKIVKLSGGMKRRVGIAQALLNDPEVLILDEPTSGLDPGERVRFRNLLSEFAHERIVLISTHIVSDVEYIATQNAIMKEGRIVSTGTTEKLVRSVAGKVWRATVATADIPALERKLNLVNLRNEENGRISIRYLADQAAVAGSTPETPRLEDLYLWLFPVGEKEGM